MMDQYQILEILGTIVGLVYLYLEYKASIWLWLTGIIMPAIYIFVYYQAGLYADFGINIYYLLAAVYGWLLWAFGRQKTKQVLPITHVPLPKLMGYVVLFLAAWGFIHWVLVSFTNSNVPVLDSFTTALSIVGMLMLANKYVEQWISWIAVDVVSTGLYIYKGLYFTASLYALYALIAIFGYFKWKRLMKEEALPKNDQHAI